MITWEIIVDGSLRYITTTRTAKTLLTSLYESITHASVRLPLVSKQVVTAEKRLSTIFVMPGEYGLLVVMCVFCCVVAFEVLFCGKGGCAA